MSASHTALICARLIWQRERCQCILVCSALTLQRDDICSREGRVVEQVEHALGLDAQRLDGLVAVHIARGLNRDHVRVLAECFEQHGTVKSARLVARKFEADQVGQLERRVGHGVAVVFPHERNDVLQIEYVALCRADCVREGQERQRAAVEGQAREIARRCCSLESAALLPLRRGQIPVCAATHAYRHAQPCTMRQYRCES